MASSIKYSPIKNLSKIKYFSPLKYLLASTPLLWYIKGNIPLKKEGISGDIPLILGISVVYQTNLDIPLNNLIYLLII